MELIKVNEWGYGIDGKTLDLLISIPKGSFLKRFWVANQDDVEKYNCTKTGIDYIAEVQKFNDNFTYQDAFLKLFKNVGEYTLNGNCFELYRLIAINEYVIVKVSQEDLVFVTMELYPVLPKGFKISSECGKDNSVIILPLYNECLLRLKALNEMDFIEDCSNLSNEFVNKILLTKAIELSLKCGKYCKAANFWNKLNNSKPIKITKKCKCNG